MSQYPHSYGYGQYYGQYPQQPYGYHNVPGYIAPGHSAPYNLSPPETNRDASQAAYNLNATHIPGLGIGGAAAGGAQHILAPGTATWTPQPGSATSAPAAPLPQTYGASSFGSHRSQPELDAGGPGNSVNSLSQPAPVATRQAGNIETEVEEGELSEGQFEDLYEPRESIPDDAAQTAPKPPVTADPSQPTSAVDTPDGGFYGTDDDDGGKGSGGEGRERSASYSPFLSPREIQSEAPTPQPEAINGKSDPSPRAKRSRNQVVSDTPSPDVPGLQLAADSPAITSTSSGLGKTTTTTSQPQRVVSATFKSLQEAKKEAQKAILRLWPLGIKYQNYIDEGFDERFIKGLFHDLHFDIPKTATDSPAAQLQESQLPYQSGGHNAAKPSQPSEMQSQQSAPGSKDASAMTKQSERGEERKDRIARLLAAKAAKATKTPVVLATSKPSSSLATQPGQDSTEPPKAKTWGEKERLLQQKIAALQKSRESQAQKSGTDTADSGAVQASSNGQLIPQAKPTGGPVSASIPTGPRATGVPLPMATTQLIPSQNRLPMIPVINAQPSSSNQRKRPVASDFVEHSPRLLPPKLPFGQARNETSFIIDVSDASEDEEMEMDMDLGSPVDEAPPTQLSGAHGQHGLTLRDFPPLTDTFTQRQLSSPGPSVTPPRHASTSSNKRRETELDLKEKAIQDMRRKIALAEARRKAKQSSSGTVTPKQAGLISEVKEHETVQLPLTDRGESMSSPDSSDGHSTQPTPEPSSTRLLKPSESRGLDPLHRVERRGRILSLEIPRVESSLKEKLSRLQELQDEQARLKAEIGRSLAEKRKLDDELQDLDTTPQAQSPQRNGGGSYDEPGSTVPSHAVGIDGANGHQRGVAFVSLTGKTSPHGQMGKPSSTRPSPKRIRRAGDLSLGGAGLPLEQSRAGLAPEGPNGRGTSVASSVLSSDAADESGGEHMDIAGGKADSPLGPSDDKDSLNSGEHIERSSLEGEVIRQEDAVMTSVSSPMPNESTENNLSMTSAAEEVDTAKVDETAPMDVDSRPPRPDEAEHRVSSLDAEDETNDRLQPSALLPDQISSVAQPREAEQEIETEATAEVRGEPASKLGGALKPYESPLRYFHAYRFHPEYQRAVLGGLKSLTYSNRIDPDKALCPFELNGEQCPANCEFQHFRSISPPDDQILLELGNPDEYSGEEKSRFIQGLRELLQKFKADKVKDFDTIARAIIEFRSQILGDRSKILRLEGVTI